MVSEARHTGRKDGMAAASVGLVKRRTNENQMAHQRRAIAV
jgi:hypothetical protein